MKTCCLEFSCSEFFDYEKYIPFTSDTSPRPTIQHNIAPKASKRPQESLHEQKVPRNFNTVRAFKSQNFHMFYFELRFLCTESSYRKVASVSELTPVEPVEFQSGLPPKYHPGLLMLNFLSSSLFHSCHINYTFLKLRLKHFDLISIRFVHLKSKCFQRDNFFITLAATTILRSS